MIAFTATWMGLEIITLSEVICASSLSHVGLSVTPWTVAHQGPLSMGFSGQEYWSGVPCPPPGDLLNPGIKPRSSTLQADSLPSEPPGKQVKEVRQRQISREVAYMWNLKKDTDKLIYKRETDSQT